MPNGNDGPVLLDTCALLWVSNRQQLSAAAQRELDEINAGRVDMWASPISAWEIAMLVSKGRLALGAEPLQWFQQALGVGVRLAQMPPQILVASAFLPASQLRDPADRILVATARAYGYRLMTRDALLLDYARAGHFRAIPC